MARATIAIDSGLPASETFAYLADLTNTAEWDPSVRSARRLDDGELGPGARFAAVVAFAGRELEMTYAITEYEAPRRFVAEARHGRALVRDTVTVEDAGTGSRLRYDATLTLSGATRLLDPLAALALRRSLRHARAGLGAHLGPHRR